MTHIVMLTNGTCSIRNDSRGTKDVVRLVVDGLLWMPDVGGDGFGYADYGNGEY